MYRSGRALLASCVLLALSQPSLAALRVFVSSTGSDAAACTLVAPCRSFQAAHTSVDSGGEIVALDAAGFGAVTITKSVTITANPGFFAGIAASTGNAVTIATPGVSVVLRGLNLNGVGASNGVAMTAGAQLVIENCVISNFALDGINVAAQANVRISHSVIRDNNNNGIVVDGVTGALRLSLTNSTLQGNAGLTVNVASATTGGTTTAIISDTMITNNDYVGVYVEAGLGNGRATVTRSTVSNNQYGVVIEGAGNGTVTTSYSTVTGNTISGMYRSGGVYESQGNNTVRQNGANTSGTITPVAGT